MARKTAEEIKWETESDARALSRIAELKRDPQRPKRATKLINEQFKIMEGTFKEVNKVVKGTTPSLKVATKKTTKPATTKSTTKKKATSKTKK